MGECCGSYVGGIFSPNAVHCTAAAYLLRLLMNKRCQEFNSLLRELHTIDVSFTMCLLHR